MIKLADHFLELLYLAKTNTLYIGSPLTIVVLPFGIEKKNNRILFKATV